jgi:hypothetical protein
MWIVLLVALFAVPALAADVYSTGSGSWTQVRRGPWSGSPRVGDDFHVQSGHRVVYDGAFKLWAAGSIRVQSGGEFVVAAGATLGPGAFLEALPGSTLTIEGAVRNVCRVAAEPAWGEDDSPDVTLDCDSVLSTAPGDSLVFLDEDPEGGDFTRQPVRLGPDGPGYGASYNRYAWYAITEVSGNTITYDLDSGSYVPSPDAPYAGTRGLPTTSDLVPGDMTFEPMELGLYTRVRLEPLGVQPVALHGDLGSHYLYFKAAGADALDPSTCSERAAKIIHTENDPVAGDRVYVVGDVSRCTKATARVIPGARRGDLVAVVSPATIDGSIGAPPYVGHVRIWTGANLRVRWARFLRLGYANRWNFSPPSARHCNVCILQHATAAGESPHGFFSDSEIGFLETAPGDTAAFYVSGMARESNDYRYPNAGPIDLSDLRIERLHIHDSRNEGTAAGSHGIYLEAAYSSRPWLVDGFRVERMSDDNVGGQIVANTTGTATRPNRVTLSRGLIYEALAEDKNSQEGFEFYAMPGVTQATSGLDSLIFNSGALQVRDIVAIGSYLESFAASGLGFRLDRVANGGVLVPSTTGPFYVPCLASTAAVNGQQGAYENVIRNSLVTSFQADGTSTSAFPHLCGRIEDTLVFGTGQSAGPSDTNSATDAFQSLIDCRTSVLHHASPSAFAIQGNGDLPHVGAGLARSFEDCALIAESAVAMADGWGKDTTPITLLIQRLLFVTGASSFRAIGPRGPFDLETGAVTAILDGLYATNAGPGTEPFDIDPGGSVTNVCLRSNATAAAVFGAYASATTRALPDLPSVPSGQARVGALVAVDASDDPCAQTLPRMLGLSEVGMMHVVMGDFLVEQLHPTFTSRQDLLRHVPLAPRLGAQGSSY